MSYENTRCPCGGKKPTDTMLCDECSAAFADRREMNEMNDATQSLDYRRHAAVILCALARGRRHRHP